MSQKLSQDAGLGFPRAVLCFSGVKYENSGVLIMIIALQTLVFFRHTLLAVLDRILRPYYKKLLLSFKNNGSVCEEDEADDEVYTEFDEEKGVRFYPPMYVQRYAAVTDCLMEERWSGKLQKVADLGYCDMSFIKYLKDIPGVQTILGVDVEKVPLRCAWDLLGCDDYPFKSDNALHVLLLQGNAADPDYRLIGCDAVVAIEMIEHMVPHDLERLVHTIFGFIKPMVAVITTPNKDYNVLFNEMGKNGMRHWDHRFEWTREQFNDWCSNIVQRYPNYRVRCKGVGPPPPGVQLDVGCCSQLALFSAEDYQKQQDLNLNSLRVLVSSLPEPEGNSVLDVDWDCPSETIPALSPSYSPTPTPTSLSDLLPIQEQTFKIPVKLSRSTIELPVLSCRDKLLQCNLPAETEKNFMMFSDEHESWTLLPRRRGDGDYKVYDMEDVASRLNCTTLQVKKFSKTTQRLFANHNMELAITKHVVEEIRHLTKMLNLNKNVSNENDEVATTWNNINWGDNAPYWNQYYTVIREYKYPFETKSEESLILELISDEINRLTDTHTEECAVGVATLEISLAHLMTVVCHITTDEDKVRDLLEWNGYEVAGDTVIHHRTLTLPECDSEDGNWRENGFSDWDLGSGHSDSSSMPDYCGRSLRRALDRKVRKLSALEEADMDISTELDLVVCRLIKLALRMSNGCELPIQPRWLQCKLYDLLSLTEKSIHRRKSHKFTKRCYQAIENGMEGGRSPRVVRSKGEYKKCISMKRIEDTYRHLIQNNEEDTQPTVEDLSHSPTPSHIHELSSTIATSKRIDSEFETESPVPTAQGTCLEDYPKSSPISSSTDMACRNVIHSWNNEGLASFPFMHRLPVCENSTDDTEPKKRIIRKKSPTKKKRKVAFPEEGEIANIISGVVSDDSAKPTYNDDICGVISDDSAMRLDKNKKSCDSNKKPKRKFSYNSLMKNYSIHLAQAEKEYETQPNRPTTVKPIPCSLIDLCYEELAKDDALAHKFEVPELKEGDLGTEETQIISIVIDEFAGLQDSLLSLDETIATQEIFNPVVYGVCGDFGITKDVENVTDNSEAVFLCDLDEPSTSKGIRHVNTDAQCGPDTVIIDYPLLTHTPSIKLQKMYKTGIYIGDSTTELKAEAKETIDSATVTIDNTDNAGMQQTKTPAKIMCDSGTLSPTEKRRNINHGFEAESGHKSVSSTTSELHVSCRSPNTEEKQVSSMITDEQYVMSPSYRTCIAKNIEKSVEALLDTSDEIDGSVSERSAPLPLLTEVHFTDTTRTLHALYEKQYAPPKLSIVGAHVHSYRERCESEDILYQGVWQKNRTKWTPNKRSYSDFAAKKKFITREENSKEKLKSPQACDSSSEFKNCPAAVLKRTTLRPTSSKDFITKNIIMVQSLTNSRAAFRGKKTFASKRAIAAKSNQNTLGKKAADRKNLISSSIMVTKEEVVLTRKMRINSANITEGKKYMIVPYCATNSKASNNFVTKNATVLETKPNNENNTNFKNETAIEAKPKFPVLESRFCFPSYTKVVEMNPNCISNNVVSTAACPESECHLESLAKLKQDIISSSEVLARLQHDFEQKVEKRILGTRSKKIVIPDILRQPRNASRKGNTKPVHKTSKTLINKTYLNNTKVQQKATPHVSTAPNAQKRVNFKGPTQTRPSSASPSARLTKSPVKVNAHQPFKTQAKSPVRPRSAEVTKTKRCHLYPRPPTKRIIWLSKQSVETEKLTKDVLKAHDEANPGHNYLVYCNELNISEKTDCSVLYEDPDMINKYISSSSRTSSTCSNCSSPNSVVTVRSQRQRPSTGRQSSAPKLAIGLDKKIPAHRAPNKIRNYNTTNRNNYIPPVLNLNKTENDTSPKEVPHTDYNKDIFVAQLTPGTASPLRNVSPRGRKSLSPIGLASSTKLLSPIKPILKIRDLDEITALKEEAVDSPTLSGQSSLTITNDAPRKLVGCESMCSTLLGEPIKEVVKIESKVHEDLTDGITSEVTTAMKDILEDTLKGIATSCTSQRAKWPDMSARKSSTIVAKRNKSDSSTRKGSRVWADLTDIQGHDIKIADDAKKISIKDLYERKEHITFKPVSPLALQAFSGFSMNNPAPVGDQKLDYVNLIDSETGGITTGIPTRLAASEELYISGRSSESYQSCVVDDENIVPEWLFHIVSQHEDYENEYDDDEENYPMPRPTGVPQQPIELLEAGIDINGNVMEVVPTIARTGAGDGRGIHSDQSQDSSGQGTSLSSSIDSSGPLSTVVIDSSAYPSRYDSMLDSLSDDDAAAVSTRPDQPLTLDTATPISSSERVYTLLNQAATSDMDADVSSVDTDDNGSRNHEL